MQASNWNGTSSARPFRRWLLGGSFALFALALSLSWFLRPRAGADGVARDEPREEKTASPPTHRIQWARGSQPPEAPKDESPVIRGVVLRADGAAVAGATVVAKDYQVAGNLPTTVSTAHSDENGRFELPVREGAYYIHASKEGHGPAFVRARSGEQISLLLRKSGVLEGHVRDARGAPVPHFAIDVITPLTDVEPALAPLWSGVFDSPDGSFRIAELPSYEVTIRASAAGYAPALSDPVGVAPGETSSLDFALSSGCAVEGRVADPSGMPLPEVFLDAEARTAAGILSEGSIDAISQGRSDAAGHFHLPNVPTGPIVIRAYDGAHAVTTVDLEISDCAEIDPIAIVMSLGGSVAGVVRAADGKPVPGAAVTATHRTIGFVHAVTDAEGRFHFDQVPPVLLTLEALHEGRRAQMRVEAKEDQLVEQDIALPPKGAGIVKGRVSVGGRALGGVQVVALSYSKRKRTTLQTTTAEDGSYQFTGISAGNYVLKVASTATAGGARVENDEVVTVDLAVAEVKPDN